jgi:hypothetical protein
MTNIKKIYLQQISHTFSVVTIERAKLEEEQQK